MKSLITGIAGFAGSHLADLLVSRGDSVAGLLGPSDTEERIAHLAPRLRLFAADVLDHKAVAHAFESFAPERVYHLAGMAHVGGSWGDAELTFRVNILGSVNILEGVRQAGAREAGARESGPRVLLVGSAEQYGPVPDAELPIREDRQPRPHNPYGASKAAAEILGLQYHLGHGVPVLLARAFNHIGARQDPRFVVSDFARQVALIECGAHPPEIKVGNLDARRDFTDVRDMVEGYAALMERGRPGVPYNLCSGRATRVGDLLESLLSMARVPIHVVADPERFRPLDNPCVVGDGGRAASELEWRSRIPLEETLAWTLENWRRIAAPGGSGG